MQASEGHRESKRRYNTRMQNTAFQRQDSHERVESNKRQDTKIDTNVRSDALVTSLNIRPPTNHLHRSTCPKRSRWEVQIGLKKRNRVEDVTMGTARTTPKREHQNTILSYPVMSVLGYLGKARKKKRRKGEGLVTFRRRRRASCRRGSPRRPLRRHRRSWGAGDGRRGRSPGHRRPFRRGHRRRARGRARVHGRRRP